MEEANHNKSVWLYFVGHEDKCGAGVFFYGISERPDQPTEFWRCLARAHSGPHDGAVWFSRHSSELEAIDKSKWLVEHFLAHNRFPDDPDLDLAPDQL
jgi:hypothetical protein